MVRLMLTLTPVVCILSGIAFSLIFDCHMKEEETVSREIDAEIEKKKAIADKVRITGLTFRQMNNYWFFFFS